MLWLAVSSIKTSFFIFKVTEWSFNQVFATDSDSLAHLSGNENGLETQTTVKAPTLALDNAGDVILKLEEVSLRVSSKVLAVASPVFHVMFSPHLLEGETSPKGMDIDFEHPPLPFRSHLTKDSNSIFPAIIPLPDDEPTTMTILCQVLHYQEMPSHELFVVENISKLRNLALISDKYNCIKAVSFATNAWIQALEPLEPKATQDELFNLVEVAHILDHEVLFERATKRILMNDVGAILERMIVQLWPRLRLDLGSQNRQLLARLLRRHRQMVFNRQHCFKRSGICVICGSWGIQ
jgi:hypothetical protein